MVLYCRRVVKRDVSSASLGSPQRQNTQLTCYICIKPQTDLAKTEAGTGGSGEAQLTPLTALQLISMAIQHKRPPPKGPEWDCITILVT